MSEPYDGVIVGGGPGGSTTAGLLKKYRPESRVLVVERETFPREHVGESQLPQIGAVLHELGVWDRIEAEQFPIKLGATYLWGRSKELWDFNFVPPEQFRDEARPAPYAGQRLFTALQVERSRYDDILLNHAIGLGAEVRQGTAVRKVTHADDRIESLDLSDGSTVTAKYFVDASGNTAVLRRALGVEVECPTALKNIAAWDYWDDAAWAETIGTGGTRVQVISVGFGWIWFIPIAPTRVSVGLVCPASYYKSCGKPAAELYTTALAAAPRIAEFLKNARRQGKVHTTNDWSFVADRTAGANWFLVGECAGFADPILAAGLTLTHVGGRELAYTLRALLDGTHPADWLARSYHRNQTRRVRQHMRFAEFWYAANGQFTDLQDHCQEIAAESGLKLTAQQAWAWLAQGGFTNDVLGQVAIGGCDLPSLKGVAERFLDAPLGWKLSDKNIFHLDTSGATRDDLPQYDRGEIRAVECYHRDGKQLPLVGIYELVAVSLKYHTEIAALLQQFQATIRKQLAPPQDAIALRKAVEVLEVLVEEGWVRASHDATRPFLKVDTSSVNRFVCDHVPA